MTAPAERTVIAHTANVKASIGTEERTPDVANDIETVEPGLPALRIPVEGVTPDQLTRQFDEPRSGGRVHQAIDILAPRHTPVLAASDGTIARLHQSTLGGITVYQLDSTERHVLYYAHLERYAPGLSEGDRVRRGDLIGYVGSTGNAPESTPHLHFAIFRVDPHERWWQGTPIDPYDALVESRVAQR